MTVRLSDFKGRLVALDVETTGVFNSARIVEISLLTLDPRTFDPVDEYDTMVNPSRDIGAVEIHGVTPSMLEAAPSFEEIAPIVARRIDGAVLIGHNVHFDIRMLKLEINRLQSDCYFNPGDYICTYRATHEKLDDACDSYGVEMESWHRSLTDARATAKLAALALEPDIQVSPAACIVPGDLSPRTLRRGAIDPNVAIKRKISVVDSPWAGSPSGMYQYVLNYVLDDGVIDDRERLELSKLAIELNLSPENEKAIKRLYLAKMIAAVERDDFISEQEESMLKRAAFSMGLGDEELPTMTQLPENVGLEYGMKVCFTGSAFIDGEKLNRTNLETMAVLARLIPVNSVTKKCDLLVAADVASQSGKAKKARTYGIQIMSVKSFVEFVH